MPPATNHQKATRSAGTIDHNVIVWSSNSGVRHSSARHRRHRLGAAGGGAPTPQCPTNVCSGTQNGTPAFGSLLRAISIFHATDETKQPMGTFATWIRTPFASGPCNRSTRPIRPMQPVHPAHPARICTHDTAVARINAWQLRAANACHLRTVNAWYFAGRKCVAFANRKRVPFASRKCIAFVGRKFAGRMQCVPLAGRIGGPQMPRINFTILKGSHCASPAGPAGPARPALLGRLALPGRPARPGRLHLSTGNSPKMVKFCLQGGTQREDIDVVHSAFLLKLPPTGSASLPTTLTSVGSSQARIHSPADGTGTEMEPSPWSTGARRH
eukprot:gene18901-biopygen9986